MISTRESVAAHATSATHCQTQQEPLHSLAHGTASRGASRPTPPIAAQPSASTLAPRTTSTAFLKTRGVHCRIRNLWGRFWRTRIFRRWCRRRRSSACGDISAHLSLRRFFDVPVASDSRQIGVGLQSVTPRRTPGWGTQGQEEPFTNCFAREVATCSTLNRRAKCDDFPGLQAQASGLLEQFVHSDLHQGIVIDAI
jgi:hypothetical protein